MSLIDAHFALGYVSLISILMLYKLQIVHGVCMDSRAVLPMGGKNIKNCVLQKINHF